VLQLQAKIRRENTMPDSPALAMNPLDVLQEALTAQLGSRLKKLERAYGELTVTSPAPTTSTSP
jgi:hypothetical protein